MRPGRNHFQPSCLALALLLSGCIAHDARVVVPAETAQTPHGSTTIGATTSPTPPGPPPETLVSGALPQEVTVSAWRAPDDGSLLRAEQTVLTPLPWWQRFPFDVVADVLPTTFHATAEVELALRPVAARTPDDLRREAADAGYASLPPSSPAGATAPSSTP